MGSAFEVASLRAYRESLSSKVPLERQVERDLARRWIAGDKRAGEQIVEACLPFVISIAFEYRRWGVPLEDIVQQGNLGLLRAAKKFDLSKDCRLATYAAYWIRAEIREYVVRGYRVVRLGTTKSERRALRLYRTTQESDPVKLAAASGVSPARMEMLFPLLVAREVSLDAGSKGNGDSGGATASGVDRMPSLLPTPEEEAGTNEMRETHERAIKAALLGLDAREQLIVKERMMNEEPSTLQALGDRLGVSKERVRQLEERAKSKLRQCLAALRPAEWRGEELRPAS